MTNQNRPFSIRLFVPDGDPDGLRMVERSNWTGVGVVFAALLIGIRDQLAERVNTIAERYSEPLPALAGNVEVLSKKVEGYLREMG
ncbi:hypothetical protein AB833_21730 [Chromatiales bacterium (ex Bugula neritina AB1)]|nr:hypothetical protein AB833_21730 [Chromatiales bacterium (ex Bugula neritina AB1)]